MSAAVATIKSRLPMPDGVSGEFSITESQWRVLVETTYPLAKSPEAVAMAIAYCNQRGLDVFKKPIHIVPMWNSALNKMVETLWPGIAEIRTTAARTGAYAGIDAISFGPVVKRDFSGETGGRETRTVRKTVEFPESATATVYRLVHGSRCPFTATVYWEETYATIGKTNVPNDMWEKRPRGQLAKCAEAAALRMAFPEELGSIYAAEEMEGKAIDGGEMKDITPPPNPPEHAANTEGKKPEHGPFDFEAAMQAMRADLKKASTSDEVNSVWQTHAKLWWKLLNQEQQIYAQKIASDRRSAVIAAVGPKADNVPPAFNLNAFSEDFDDRASAISSFELLDALWDEVVEAAHEGGLISNQDKESVLAPIYDKHRARIDEIFPMDRG